MSAVDELVPLHTDFDLVWRGCDREQVRQYVARVETELRLLTVDRDAAVRRADALAEQLAAARAEVRALTERLDRVCRTPVDPDGLRAAQRTLAEAGPLLAPLPEEKALTEKEVVAEKEPAAA